MLRPAGDHVKTDKRDASFLARMLAVGNIVEVAIPTPEFEAARDLSRAREDCRHDLMRARNLLSKFLLRKGIVYEKGKSTWSVRHKRWLSSLCFDELCEQMVFEEYLEAIRFLELKKDRLDEAIFERSKKEDISATVAALSCIRGISTLTAFTIAVEIGDFSRFSNARSFMSYLGLVPSENSSGESVSRGRITRSGNAHVRTILTEAAWHHARPLRPLSERRLKADPSIRVEIIEAAASANRRLRKRSEHLIKRGKPASLTNTAIARELSGFVWAIANMATN